MDFIYLYPAQIIAVLFLLLLISLIVIINIKGDSVINKQYYEEAMKLLSDANDSHWKHYHEMKEAYTKYGNECLQYAKDSRSVLLKYMLWIEEKYPDINDEFSKHITTQSYENENIEGRV